MKRVSLVILCIIFCFIVTNVESCIAKQKNKTEEVSENKGTESFAVDNREEFFNALKPNAYRLGIGDSIEKVYVIENHIDNVKVVENNFDESNVAVMNWANLDMKRISREIQTDINYSRERINEDLQVLWLSAATKSETIKFAIYKLSTPEGNKSNDSIVKKIIKPIANMSTFAGIGFANPAIAASTIASGQLLGHLSVNDNDLNYKYSKVTDSDMVVLVNKIDNLQKDLASKYFDYMSARKVLDEYTKVLDKRELLVQKAFYLNDKNLNLVADTYFKNALDNFESAKSDFIFKRSALEQIVGPKAMQEFEKSLTEKSKID